MNALLLALALGDFQITGRQVGTFEKTDREYENLRLSFEYNLAQWAEAAVVLRSPDRGRPMRSGIAITFAHDFHQKLGLYVTGAVSGRQAPKKLLPEHWGKWTPVVIEFVGQRLKVTIAGQLLQDTTVERKGPGFVLFPDLGHPYRVRNIRIEDLGAPTKIMRPFAGETAQRGGGTFTRPDPAPNRDRQGADAPAGVRAIIKAENGHGILYAKPAFRDFTLAMYVRSHHRVNAGVFLRGDAREGHSRGFEVQIYSPPDAVYPTGSIYSHVRSNVAVDYEERWFYLEIDVRGTRCVVRVDGDVVAQANTLPDNALEEGQIGLQIHSDQASVEYDDIRVIE